MAVALYYLCIGYSHEYPNLCDANVIACTQIRNFALDRLETWCQFFKTLRSDHQKTHTHVITMIMRKITCERYYI